MKAIVGYYPNTSENRTLYINILSKLTSNLFSQTHYKCCLGLLFSVCFLGGCVSHSNTNHKLVYADEPICVSATTQTIIDCPTFKRTHIEPTESTDNATDSSVAGHSIYQAPTTTHPLLSAHHTAMLSEYLEQLALQLLPAGKHRHSELKVAVTSFIEFSPELTQVTLLGNTLSELFIHELQQNGINVVDYKVIDQVAVMPHGDFVFSRNPQQLSIEGNVKQALTGTIMYHKRGIILNVRMIDLESKQVMASGQKLIPYFILDSMIPLSNKSSVMVQE